MQNSWKSSICLSDQTTKHFNTEFMQVIYVYTIRVGGTFATLNIEKKNNTKHDLVF